MPAWSPEVGEEFVRLASQDGRAFSQGQLQKLVYIAHGWCLALTAEPLTGDRPEAWEHGPVYRRLADALAAYGLEPVATATTSENTSSWSEMDPEERALIARVYNDYGTFGASSLATLTRRGEAPWVKVFDGGAGKNNDISHALVREQFRELARQLAARG